ncbi:MAG: AraC family transcriptional regulator [Steroidobacteraceae bacterium]
MRTPHSIPQSAAVSPAWHEVLGHAPARSSASLGWQHIEVHRFDALRCWNLTLPPVAKHFIAAHLLKPCRIETRWSGRLHRAGSQPGNAMLMSAGQDSVWHCSEPIDELHVFLDPTIVEEVAQEVGSRRFELIDGVGIVDPTIREISLQLLAEIEHPGMGTRLFADTMARALALQIIRRRSTARFIEAARPACMTPRQLRAATDYIESHLGQDLSLESLSAAPAMSPFRFARAFKRATGQSPRQYVITRRVERAKELLRSGGGIADIAHRVGFSTQSHFTAVFHRHCGITPKRFRDALRP